MTRWGDTREEQGDGQEDMVAASMDSDWIIALSKWLDTPKAEISAQLESDPRQFLAAHVQHLPEPLLRPLTSLMSPVERGTIAVIAQRRRAAATQDASRPAELDVEASRRRLPVLSKTLLRRDAVRVRPTAFAKLARGAPLDPPFPDHPAATVPGFQEIRGPEASQQTQYGPAHEGDLFSHPRLTRLMDEQDAEEEQEEAAREAEREQCEEVDEDEDEGEDGEPDEEGDEMDLETFQLAVIERFVKGDPTLPDAVYDRIDFDDRLDRISSVAEPDISTGTTASTNIAADTGAAARERERIDEERWFDDDDDE